MAEAAAENNAFISLKDARALLAEAWQFAPYLAEKDIREALWRGQIHCRAWRMRARWDRDKPRPTIAVLCQNADVARIDWDLGSATVIGEHIHVTFYRVELFREHVDQLLPEIQRERAAPSVEAIVVSRPVAPPRVPFVEVWQRLKAETEARRAKTATSVGESAPQPDVSPESEPPLTGKLAVTVRAIDALRARGVAFDASGEEARRSTIRIEARKLAENSNLSLSLREVRRALAHRKKWPRK